jgi:hypothetical protein
LGRRKEALTLRLQDKCSTTRDGAENPSYATKEKRKRNTISGKEKNKQNPPNLERDLTT